MFKKLYSVLSLGLLALMAFVAVPVQSAHATIAELFTAVDVSSISTNVQTLMIAFIGISLLFVGFRYIRKLIGR